MKSQRSEEQFYPKLENENPLLGVQQFEPSVRSVDSGSFLQSPRQPSYSSPAGQIPRSQAGQIVVEYVLMLLVAISIAVLLINLIVSRKEDDPGFLIKAWNGIIKTISEDKTDEVPPANPGQTF